MSDRVHNKSGLSGLTLLSVPESTLEEWSETLQTRINEGTTVDPDNCIADSPCVLLQSKKGTLSINTKHVCFGYQLVAYNKFGKEIMRQIPANKVAESKLISHLCGTRNCCNADHLVIETKRINDERTHCHFCMRNVLRRFNKTASKRVARLICPHEPLCGSLNA